MRNGRFPPATKPAETAVYQRMNLMATENIPQTVTETVVTELHLVWDGQNYFLNRIRPKEQLKPERLTAERAADIIRLNESEPGVEISTRGKVEIGSEWGWSWMAKIKTRREVELHE